MPSMAARSMRARSPACSSHWRSRARSWVSALGTSSVSYRRNSSVVVSCRPARNQVSSGMSMPRSRRPWRTAGSFIRAATTRALASPVWPAQAPQSSPEACGLFAVVPTALRLRHRLQGRADAVDVLPGETLAGGIGHRPGPAEAVAQQLGAVAQAGSLDEGDAGRGRQLEALPSLGQADALAPLREEARGVAALDPVMDAIGGIEDHRHLGAARAGAQRHVLDEDAKESGEAVGLFCWCFGFLCVV